MTASRRVFVAIIGLLTLVGCKEMIGGETAITIKHTHLGADWPLRVPDGMLTCTREPGEQSIWISFEFRGHTYPLNESARAVAAERGWRDISEIQAEENGSPKSLDALMKRASLFCRESPPAG